MGALVGAFAVSHTSLMVRAYDKADPVKAARIREAFVAVRKVLEQLEPDAVIVVSSEHFKTFFLDNFPTFCIGVAPSYKGWGDGGIPAYSLPGDEELARHLLGEVVEASFDVSFSEEFRLDHGFMTPMHMIGTDLGIPIVPIFQNCTVRPMPRISRCFEFGRALRRAIEVSDRRVVIIAAGGLSHWVGVPGMGQVNSDFDLRLLSDLSVGAADRLLGLSVDELDHEAGNGSQEIRNWATMIGAANPQSCTVHAYEPVPEWATGIAVLEAGVRPLSGGTT